MTTVGFTGTRHGMTQDQAFAVFGILPDFDVLRHGDCVGADEEAHHLTRGRLQRILHPPTDPKCRAWCEGDVVLPEKPYLERNADIVDQSDFLLAAPQQTKDGQQPLQGGTWWTIRYARRQGKPGLIVWPDGTTSPIETTPA